MAKKSLIAGEYIIEIADNGHVDVMRVFRNAKVTMENIAKSKDFPVEVKWNTRTLGRHLVQEFGDGKTAQFDDITVNRFPNGQIEIYQKCKNVIDALRTIAKQLGFAYEDTWNTQTFGSKLSDYLIEHKEEADKILQTKNARRKKDAENTSSMGKTYTLRIGGERGFRVGVYSCGYEGDELYERAMEVAENDDDDEKRELIDELNDDFDTHIASWFVQPLTEDYTTHVEVEDEDGNIIFEDDLEASQGAYSGDPRKWDLSNLPANLASAIKSAIDKYADELAKCKNFDDWSEEDVLNDDLCSDLTSTIVSAPLKSANLDTDNLPLVAVDCPSIYTFCYEGKIIIPEDEEFDADKLRLIVSDYEDYCPECADSVLPVIQYGNAFYQLECEDWEEHYSDIRILDLGGYDDKVYISF